VDKTYERTNGPDVRVAVVGAGLAGLACARRLAEAGAPVVVFEKSRGPSGRCSTRREERGSVEPATGEPRAFDHGAQYYTVRDPSFESIHREWLAAGAAAPWSGRIAAWDPRSGWQQKDDGPGRHVGVPGMNALGRHLSRGLEVRTEATVKALRRAGTSSGEEAKKSGAWELRLQDGAWHGPWAAIVCTAPAAQAAALVAAHDEPLARLAASLEAAPCWALMFDAEGAILPGRDGVFINDHALAWAAREASKPGRQAGGRWTIHASAAWSREHLELDAAEAALRLHAAWVEWLRSVGDFAGANSASHPTHLVAHRWRYSIPLVPAQRRCAASADGTLVLAGDAHGGPRVEGAVLSGLAAAEQVLATLGRG
jgi:predicted NAD/FAD-dependent oxidoreductase